MDYVSKYRRYQLNKKKRLNRMPTIQVSILSLLILKESEKWEDLEVDIKISFKTPENRNGLAAPYP